MENNILYKVTVNSHGDGSVTLNEIEESIISKITEKMVFHGNNGQLNKKDLDKPIPWNERMNGVWQHYYAYTLDKDQIPALQTMLTQIILDELYKMIGKAKLAVYNIKHPKTEA